jgi:pSer/pThr/pTyr-binding forkhead associated (FHA) protein
MPALLTKSLGVVCPSCDFLNVVAAVRCMACGTATDAPAAAPRAEVPRVQPTPVEITHSANEATVPGAPMPQPPPAAPPGLKRSTTGPVPVAPIKGQPTRPTFSSSAPTQTTPQIAGPKFGLTVLAGPARGQRFRLAATGAQVGRAKGAILFPDDPFVSPLHATLSIRDGKLFVRDESSTSGVYVSINGTETIPSNGTFCTGLRLFRFVGAVEPAAPWNKSDVLVYGSTVPNGQVHYAVEEVMLGDRGGRCLLSPGPVLTVGQGRCDFSYPNDEGLAPRHCEISPLPDGAMIRDLSGGLGTYVRVTGERPIKAGDRLRVGQQTLQVEALS